MSCGGRCTVRVVKAVVRTTSKLDVIIHCQPQLLCDHIELLLLLVRSLQKSASDAAYQHTIEQLLEEKRAEISDYEADQVSR